MAQGSRLTEEQIARVSEALDVTPSWRTAARHAGIGERTIYRYRERYENYMNRHENDVADLADETDPDYPYFVAVQEWFAARGRLGMKCAQGLLEHGEKDWKAHHTILKALDPQDWSERLEVTGAGGGPVQIEQLKEEALARAEQAIEEIRAKRQAAGTESPEISGNEVDSAGN